MPIKQVRVKINDVWTVLTGDGDGNYSAQIAAPNKTSYNINSGHYYPVTIEATNMADTSTTINDSDSTFGSTLRLYVKELTAPTITISYPTANSYIGSGMPTIKFTVVDEADGSGVNISSLSMTLDSKTYTNTSTGVTVKSITNGYEVELTPTSALSDGSHTFSMSVSDNDGNSANATRTFTTDTIAPVLSVTNPSTSGGYTANSSLTVTGTATDSTSGTPTVTIKLNGTDQGSVSVSSGNFSKAVTLTTGENTIVVTATDKAGKTSTITRTIILDTSSPVIASINISPNPVNVGANYTVTVSITE